MMNDVEFWLEIRLLPIAGSTPSPMRRALARTAWRRSPVASIRYEPERDRILIQLVGAPTVAEAIPGEAAGGDLDQPEGGQFAGFDGTEPDAWPTMIVVLEFSRCRDSDVPRMRLARELCGDHIWTAARSAAHQRRQGLLEVPLGQDEAEFLIRRWHVILCPPSATGGTGSAMPGHHGEGTGADPGRSVPRTPRYGHRATTLNGTAGRRGGPPDREPR